MYGFATTEFQILNKCVTMFSNHAVCLILADIIARKFDEDRPGQYRTARNCIEIEMYFIN
jgi:hypothetical protein